MSAVLETIGLDKSFGALAVARDVSLRLDKGARHALIGPNGAGKTTFINLLTGVLTPDSGTVRLGGRDVTRLAPERRCRLGLARTFQINQLFPSLSAIENVLLALAEREDRGWHFLRPLGHHGDLVDEAADLLRRLDLDTVAARPVQELAYGQQRLVEIAIALAARPRVLLLDEPAAGLPTAESGRVLDLIESLDPDIAVLVIEHDMDFVFRIARRISVLVGGAILVEGTPREIAEHEAVRDVYLGGGSHGR